MLPPIDNTEIEIDIFSSGFSTLFSYPEINQGDHGETMSVKFPKMEKPIELQIANIDASNTKLFAHHIWKAAILLGKFLSGEMKAEELEGIRVLELGSAAGIPSIICSLRGARVTASDYPDQNLIKTLKKNLEQNGFSIHKPRVIGHIWGERGDELISKTGEALQQFDLIMLSDTLWMANQHDNLLNDLRILLAPNGRILGAAGLHTGFRVFDSFFRLAEKYQFDWTRKVYRIPLGNGFNEDVEWEEDSDENVIDEPVERQRWLYKFEMFHTSSKLEQ